MTNIVPLFSAGDIKVRVEALAAEISARRTDDFLVVGVLIGSFMFVADLMRALAAQGRHPRVEFIRLASYGGATRPQGAPHLIGAVPENLNGQDILLIDDIVDTGHSMATAKSLLLAAGARAVDTCALLDKPSRREVTMDLDHVGFEIDDVFVVGYGIDYAQAYRHLPYIGKVAP